MSYILVIAMFLSFLSGCVSTGNPQIKDQALTSQIKIGATTKTEIVKMFGAPQSVFHTPTPDNPNQEIWSYQFSNLEYNPLVYIPIIGLFLIANMDNVVHSEIYGTSIAFDQNDIVAYVHRQATNTDTVGIDRVQPIAEY